MANLHLNEQLALLKKKIHGLEKELEQSKQQSKAFESILNTGKIGVLTEGLEGKITYTNQAFNEIFDISPDVTLVGKNCTEATISQIEKFEDGSAFIETIQQNLKNDQPVFDQSFKLKDGRILKSHFLPYSSQKLLNGNIWIYFDTSDIENLKEESEKNKALLELFFNQSLTGFFFMMLDEPIEWNESSDKEKALDYIFEHQRVTKVNQAFLDQYLAKEEEFLGFKPKDFFEHDLAYGRKIWGEFFDKGKWHVHTHEKRFDGTDMVVDGDYICLYDEKGRITGQFGIQQDVTEQEALKKKNIEKTEALKKLNNEKDMLFSVVSHDLRSAFGLLERISELMSEKVEDKDYREIDKLVSPIRMAVIDANSLVSNLLDWSKMNAGYFDMEENEIDLSATIDTTLNFLKSRIQEKKLKVETDLEPKLTCVNNLNMLQTVLRNIIGNAIKFSHHEGSIFILARKTDESLNITVEDQGIGIEKKALQNLFTRKHSQSTLGTERETGSGIGLSICKEFVEKMHGEISISSKLGKGTKVSVKLPIEKH